MTITKFSDIPAAVWVNGDLIKSPLEFHARLTEWFLYNTPDESMPLSAVPAAYREKVSDALWNDDVSTFDGVLTSRTPGDKPMRRRAVSLITKLHDDDLSFADVTTMCGSEDAANRVLDWCSRRGFAQQRGDIVSLDGILARLRDYAEPKPKAAPEKSTPVPDPDPAYASDIPTEPSPAAVTVPSTSQTAKAPKPVPAAAPEVIPAPRRVDLTEKELRGIRIALEQLVHAQQSPRPTPVTDIGLSPVMDCARELAVLLDATGPVTRNVLRERVRTKLRPYTTTALAFGVERGAFTLAGSPVRGGEYALTDPEALDLSWATIRSLSKSRKPARALAGTRGT